MEGRVRFSHWVKYFRKIGRMSWLVGFSTILSSNKIMSGLLDTQQYRQELLTNIEAKEREVKHVVLDFVVSLSMYVCVSCMYLSSIHLMGPILSEFIMLYRSNVIRLK